MTPKLTQEGVDVSGTESLLVAISEALIARERVNEIKQRYERFTPDAFGEPPLAVVVKEPEEIYIRKLDALRALLTRAGLNV